MKDEIKEILDKLKDTADTSFFAVYGSQEELDKAPKYTANFLSINDRKAKVLLDYITKLQEENKRLNNEIERLDNIIILQKIKLKELKEGELNEFSN